MKLATLHDVQDTREADVFDKTQWASCELLLIAGRYADATVRLENARVAHSLAGMRSAYLDLETARDQISFQLEGVQHAIENETKRREIK